MPLEFRALAITLSPGGARTDGCPGALTLSCSLAFDMAAMGCTHPLITGACVSACVCVRARASVQPVPRGSGCDLSRSCLDSFS